MPGSLLAFPPLIEDENDDEDENEEGSGAIPLSRRRFIKDVSRPRLQRRRSILGDEREQSKQEEEKPAEEVHEQERARAFKAREEDILVVDEPPVEGEAKGDRKAQLVPRKEETERHEGNEQGHVDNGDRKLHFL